MVYLRKAISLSLKEEDKQVSAAPRDTALFHKQIGIWLKISSLSLCLDCAEDFRGGRQHNLPDPRHISDRWQSISPGSLHNSTTSRHSVSGVTGTSVKCWSLLLRYTVRNIWRWRGTYKDEHKTQDPCGQSQKQELL